MARLMPLHNSNVHSDYSYIMYMTRQDLDIAIEYTAQRVSILLVGLVSLNNGQCVNSQTEYKCHILHTDSLEYSK